MKSYLYFVILILILYKLILFSISLVDINFNGYDDYSNNHKEYFNQIYAQNKLNKINSGSICLYKRNYDNDSSFLRNIYLLGIPFLSNSIYYHIGIILKNPFFEGKNIPEGTYVLHYVYNDFDIITGKNKNGICLTPINNVKQELFVRNAIGISDNVKKIDLEKLYKNDYSHTFPNIYNIAKKALEIENNNHICTSFVHDVLDSIGVKTDYTPLFPSEFSYYFGEMNYNAVFEPEIKVN